MNIAPHTPTPWLLDDEWVLKDEDTPIASAHVNAAANAAFIVRACNAHASLVNALTLLVEKVHAEGGSLLLRDELQHARAALAAAGAQ
jgi:hypothetical protein